MGNSQGPVTADTPITKEEATSAVLAAFQGTSSGQKMSIKQIASHLPPSPNVTGAGDAGCQPENPHWRTSYQMMTDRTPRKPPPAGPLKSFGGMVIGGATPRSRGGATTGFSWRAAIDSGLVTRDQRMSKIRQMFQALDNDSSRVVTREEFISDLQTDGIDGKEATALFNELDETHTGRLTLAKFDHYVAVHTLSMVRDTFKKLDQSHDRQLSKKEFVQYFLGNGLSHDQADALWSHMDANGNGQINFVEYRDWAKETLATASLDEVSMKLGLS
eukprot:gb/GFBE01047070.1/.p1 GENE.gb/GFBE01047070.1/~~gb/GFBE01047070.1/.p1  ORF type:complete len:274 (+),score=42.75 gb/GFBE01047070.1/:1-822(+)